MSDQNTGMASSFEPAANDAGHEQQCDCASTQLRVEMSGIEHDPILRHERRQPDGQCHASMNTLFSAPCGTATDTKFAKRYSRDSPFAKVTTVSTPSCGAGKFLATLFPCIDAAIKMKRERIRDGNLHFSVVQPTVLIVEPDTRRARRTSYTLQKFNIDYTLHIRVGVFKNDDPTIASCEENNGAGDITVCTPNHANFMLRTGMLSLGVVQLSLWNASEELFGQHYGAQLDDTSSANFTDAYTLFAAVNQPERNTKFIFAAQSSKSEVLSKLSSEVSASSEIGGGNVILGPLYPQHHASTVSWVRAWERISTAAGPATTQSHHQTPDDGQQSVEPRSILVKPDHDSGVNVPLLYEEEDVVDTSMPAARPVDSQVGSPPVESVSVLSRIPLQYEEDPEEVVSEWERRIQEAIAGRPAPTAATSPSRLLSATSYRFLAFQRRLHTSATGQTQGYHSLSMYSRYRGYQQSRNGMHMSHRAQLAGVGSLSLFGLP